MLEGLLALQHRDPLHILSGEWSRWTGGRLNYPNLYRVVYLATDAKTAQVEAERIEAPYVVRDEAARALWAELYPGLSEGQPGMLGAILSRAEAQALRLSALYAVLDRAAVVRPAHLGAGLAVWRYAEASARRIFGGLLGSPVADTILEGLRARGPMAERGIYALFSRHQPASEIPGGARRARGDGQDQM
jgi:hypothetical protein